MKTIIISLAALALLSTGAMAGGGTTDLFDNCTLIKYDPVKNEKQYQCSNRPGPESRGGTTGVENPPARDCNYETKKS